MDRLFVAVKPLASVTWTVKLEAPAPVGVPLITPVVAAKERPVGNEPLVTLQEYESVPPVAANVWVYAEFTVPFAKDVVVTDIFVGATKVRPVEYA